MPPASRPPAPRPSSGAASSRSAPRPGRGGERTPPTKSPRKPGTSTSKPAGGKASSTKPSGAKQTAASATGPRRPAAPRTAAARQTVLRSGGARPRKRSGQEPTGWLRVFTVRSAVLVLVALMAFVLVTPTAVQYLKQQDDLRALQADVDATRAENDELANELDRWGDDKYVIAQARRRLTFVFPGETPYLVIDPESVVEETDPATGKVVQDGAVTSGLDVGQPWYSTVWETVQVAGDAP